MASTSKTVLLCAYTLAKAGRFTDAEELILSDSEASRTAEAMDLLARIRAEQGNIAEARRLWQEIQVSRPEYLPAQAALADIGKAPFRHFRILLYGGCALAAVLLILVGLLLGLNIPDRTSGTKLIWPDIPTGAMLDTLAAYRGQTTRVMLSSAFFADPTKVAQRAMLTDMIAERLSIPTSAIFFGTAEGTSIHVEIETP